MFDVTIHVEFQEDPMNIEVEMETPVVQVVTSDHDKLKNRDVPDQHPMSAITDLEETIESIKKQKVGNGLKYDAEGHLAVDTADEAEQDNTLPITSAAVYTSIGNIEALLQTI